MSPSNCVSGTFSRSQARRAKRRYPATRHQTARLCLEQLESRVTPSYGLSTLAFVSEANGVAYPGAALVRDGSGNLYGIEIYSGTPYGAIFELAKGSSTPTTLASFDYNTSGAGVDDTLIMDSSGNLYGTANTGGGAAANGTVFELAQGSGTITTLASFNGTDGSSPYGTPVMDSSGNLYGTTAAGGASNDGTVYELAKSSGTITTLASFNGTNGSNSQGGLIMDKSGNLYGTTGGGGASGDGTVFELAKGSGTITTLGSLTGSNGNGTTAGLIADSSGNLYGTASAGGSQDDGTVFELAKGASKITALASFNANNGATPLGPLTMDSSGNLYGTAYQGGENSGTVFELAKGSNTITALALFNSYNGGAPSGGLIMDSSGNFYGTANNVFELMAHAPALTWTPAPINYETPLSSTQLDATAADSVTAAAVAGTFVYTPVAGTILQGGSQPLSVTFTPTDTTHYSPITTQVPLLVQPVTPVLTWNTPAPIYYGSPLSSAQLDATAADPTTGSPVSGTFVYSLAIGTIITSTTVLFANFTPTDTADYTTARASVTLVVLPTTVLTWNTPASIPFGTPLSSTQLDASAADVNTGSPVSGTFVYKPGAGTILGRGTTILNVTFTPTDTAHYNTATASVSLAVTPFDSFATLASFNSSNSFASMAGLVMDGSGNLYGTASKGGANGDGSVFELARGSSTLTTLASFNGSNGSNPAGALIMDSSGNLYGTTENGGASGLGTIFELAKGSSTVSTLASFAGSNGSNPVAGLIMDGSGNLYGTAEHGGGGLGTVFELVKGSNTARRLASFLGSNGSTPVAGLIMDKSGNLYGTTQLGGIDNLGTVFELAHNSFTITTLASFTSYLDDEPLGGLIMDSSGNLYGTTSGGARGPGAVFERAHGSPFITTLASFNGTNGSRPRAGLIMDSSGNLYGTTDAGGASKDGTVFELAKGSGAITTLFSFNGTNGSNPLCGLIMDSSGNLYGTTSAGDAGAAGNVFELLTPPALQISAFPPSTRAGATQTFTVTVQNADGTTDTGYTGTVHFTSSDPQAVLPADYAFTTADAGIHTFSATLKTAGTQSITAADLANALFTGNATTTVTPASASSLSIGGFPSPTIAGSAANVTVTALDAYGNIATGYTGTVHFTSGDPRKSLPANYTFTTADNGVHTFTATLRTAGTQTIGVADTVTATIQGAQTGIVVTPNVVTHFNVALFPSPEQAGVIGSFRVIARDAYNNTVPSYLGTVHFTTSDPAKGVRLPANYTFTSSDQGIHTFHATLFTAGTQSLTATDTVTSSITGSQTGIVITPAAVTHFRVYGFANPTTSGLAHLFIVQAKDLYGNVVTGYTGTVSFSSSDPQATLPAPYTFTSGDAGVHTFSGMLFTVGTQSITATDTVSSSVTGAQTGIVVNAGGTAPGSNRVLEAVPLPNSGVLGTEASALAPSISVLPASAAAGFANFAAILAVSEAPSSGIPRASELGALGDLFALRTPDMPKRYRVATDQLFDLDSVGEGIAPSETPGNRFSATAWFDESDSAG
jgi:uncharacterized repeat protein (TIGR03803 family)